MNKIINISIKAVILCLIITFSHTFAQTWTSLNGPWRAKDAKDITVGYVSSTRVLYSSVYESGLVKSTDDGATWSSTGTQVNYPFVTVCKPADADIVNVSTYDGATGKVKWSGDGGSNFTTIVSEAKLEPRCFGMSSANPNYVFLGTKYTNQYSTLRKSTDGGQSWVAEDEFDYSTTQIATNILAIAWHPTDAGKVWVAGSSQDVRTAAEQEQLPPPENQNYEPEEEYIDPYTQESITLIGGLWYSSNAGNNWTQKEMSSNLSNKEITALAVNMNGSATTIWAGAYLKGTASSYLYKSTDDGTNWTLVQTFSKGTITNIVANSSNHRVYVSNNLLGLTYSFDDFSTSYSDNSTETHDAMFDFDVRAVAIDPNNPDNAFVATASSIFKGDRSSPGYIDWRDINTGITHVSNSSVCVSGSTLLAVSKDFHGISRYTSGDGWKSALAGITDYLGHLEGEFTGFDAENSNRAFVAGAVPTTTTSSYKGVILYNDANGSGSWQIASISTAANANYRFYGLAPDTRDLNRYIAYGLSRGSNGTNDITTQVFVSNSNGSGWSARPAICSTTKSAYAMAVDSLDGQTTFAHNLYAGVEYYGLYTTTNAGDNWTHWSVSNSNINTIALNQYSPQVVYAGGPSGMWKSTNGGTSWSSIRTDNVKKILLHPSYPNSVDDLFVIANGGSKIYQTSNGGASWWEITGNLPGEIKDLRSSPDAGFIYVATSSGIYKYDIPPLPFSTLSWTTYNQCADQYNHPKLTWSLGTQESDLKELRIYRKKANEGSYTSIDTVSITTTEFIDCGITVYYQCLSCSQADSVRYYVVKVDSGSNTALSNITAVPVAHQENQGKTIPISDLITINKPTAYDLQTNYPNPFNPTTTIKYAIPEDGYVFLKVYDVLGREVATLVDEYQKANWYEVKFDAAKLPSGVYFYKFNAGKFSKVGKMMLAK
jgi:photosystem II stability/assembly factor-like uncharacterized protein